MQTVFFLKISFETKIKMKIHPLNQNTIAQRCLEFPNKWHTKINPSCVYFPVIIKVQNRRGVLIHEIKYLKKKKKKKKKFSYRK